MIRSIIAVLLFLSISISAQDHIFFKYKDEISQNTIKTWQSDGLITELTSITIDKTLKLQNVKPLTSSDDLRLSRIYKMTYENEAEKQNILAKLSSDPSIEYAQESTNYKIDFIPNDSLIAEQWGLEKIEAFGAWDITQGSEEILIGVIDTGLDYFHEDLQKSIFVNAAEDLNGNGKLDEGDIDGIDNDNNGFTDDVIGWDFVDRVGFPFDPSGGDYLDWDNDPMDENGHGTYVAGIIGAESNNIRGISGVVPNAKIMILRAFDPSGYGEEDDVAAAILYAVEMGVDVLNMSFGDNAFSFVLKDVIEYAYQQGVVLVGSAGNTSSDLPHYPSGYNEVICVGASTNNDFLSSFSNTGSTIDLVAPGSAILTTDLDNKYTSINGTSASTPFVTGAAALLKSVVNFSNEEIKQVLKTTSDDIDSKGWDLRTGAGRLNLRRALQITAPSEIGFSFPRQDYATMDNSVRIDATVLSPFFINYNLYYGIGLNPEEWVTLIADGQNQFSNSTIYDLDITSFKDSAYTLRLEVSLSNGSTTEERVNFYIDRTPPNPQLVNFGPAYYGEKSTVFASVFTDELCVVNMFFREKGTTEFNFVSLDGFATNNKFVKQLHYGFIPKSLVNPNTDYEIYFEAENLVGLKTVVKNEGVNFETVTDSYFQAAASNKLNFNLPPGRLFQDPLSITSSNQTNILMNENSNPRFVSIHEFNGSGFTKMDSIENRIVKSAGDFNSNGKFDMLSLFIRNGFIDEQTTSTSASFTNKVADSSGKFWPILADDIDDDGFTEVLALESDSTITIHQVGSDLSLTLEDRLINFSDVGLFGNSFESPNAVIADVDNDNQKEIWIIDSDGDLISYNISSANNYSNKSVIATQFIGTENILTAGDFNGDGIDEVAVMLQSSEDFDIAPFNLLVVFNLLGNELNIIYQRAFIDPSIEFNSAFQKVERSLRFANIDSQAGDELILFAFPYSYIFKFENQKADVIFYKEGINSNSIFVGDLNNNGVKEVAFPTNDLIEFYEFGEQNKALTPSNVDGYSIDSSEVFLSWNSNDSFFRIFRGTESTNLSLYDSTNGKSFTDANVIEEETYFYSIQAVNPVMQNQYSDLSSPKSIYVHNPAKLISIDVNGNKNLLISFSDKVLKTIENIAAFEIVGVGTPQSVSPNSEISYLLTFKEIPLGENTLVIKNIRDFYGSPIESDTMKFTVNQQPQLQEFFVSSHSIQSSNQIKINFNLDVDTESAVLLSNYTFEPENSITNAAIDGANPRSIILTSAKPVGSLGKEYLLRIKNIVSSVGSGAIPIKEGAGSFIVLSSFAENISDVYVYPNPFKLNGNSSSLTFANLTQNAKITIFTLSGIMVKELEETDGNGGVNWDLKDETGEIVSSGIYIYRVVSLDEFENEVEEKIEKFAVIR